MTEAQYLFISAMTLIMFCTYNLSEQVYSSVIVKGLACNTML